MAKCVIFDLDGTILDTISTITYYVNKTLEGEHLAPITEDECKYFAGNGARVLIERTLAARGIYDESEIERVLSIYKPLYDSEPLYLTRVFPGMEEQLRELKARGYLLGVVSNKPNSAAVPTVRHFFGDLFDCVSGALEGTPVKPDPTLCNIILEKLGSSAEECVFVGDTSVDIETGTNLGAARRVGVLWGFRLRDELARAGADVICEQVSDLAISVMS